LLLPELFGRGEPGDRRGNSLRDREGKSRTRLLFKAVIGMFKAVIETNTAAICRKSTIGFLAVKLNRNSVT
jgi:hypothetical protein